MMPYHGQCYYAEHIHDCPIALNQNQDCNCGLEELHIAAAAVRTARMEAGE
jgi:hypothetical protein